jgi:hypothetical protein
MSAQIGPPRVFISYSRQDEVLRRALEVQLAALRQQGVIADWAARDIGSGQLWTTPLGQALRAGVLALVLVTPHFLESAAQCQADLSVVLARAEPSRGKVVPVILRPVKWGDSPLRSLEPLPRNGQPVSTWRDQEAAWNDVQEGIRQLVATRLRARNGQLWPAAPAVRNDQETSPADLQEHEYGEMLASLPADLLERVEFLIEKRDAGTLTDEEDQELQALAIKATELATQHLEERLSDAGHR